MKKAALFAIGWLACGFAAAGSLNAALRHDFYKLDMNPRHAKMDWVFSLSIGIFGGPFALANAALWSEGFAHGWTLSSKPHPCTGEYRKIWCED